MLSDALYPGKHPPGFINKKEAKPVEHIQRLIESFQSQAKEISTSAHHPLNLSDANNALCFLLHRGHVDLFNPKQNLVLNTEHAPFVFGFSRLCSSSPAIALMPSSDAVFSVLPLANACDIVAKKQLWQSLSYLLMYLSSRVYDHSTRLSQMNSYETVRNILLELCEESEELRAETSVLHYIQSRSYLSRSGIMRILSELRAGNYITLQNGTLVDVQTLPKKF